MKLCFYTELNLSPWRKAVEQPPSVAAWWTPLTNASVKPRGRHDASTAERKQRSILLSIPPARLPLFFRSLRICVGKLLRLFLGFVVLLLVVTVYVLVCTPRALGTADVRASTTSQAQ